MMIKAVLKNSASKNGFVLVELLVTIGIIALLSSILIVYSHTGEKQVLLFRDQAKVINSIMRAKSLSVQSFEAKGNICGYGVHFNLDGAFVIFEHSSDNCEDFGGYSDSDKIIKIENLDEKLYFSLIDFDDIFFLPPDPTVMFYPIGSSGIKSIVIGSRIDENSSVKVNVNNMGQITSD